MGELDTTGDARPAKRSYSGVDTRDADGSRADRDAVFRTLLGPVSPPQKRKSTAQKAGAATRTAVEQTEETALHGGGLDAETASRSAPRPPAGRLAFASPFRLTAIRALPPAANIDTITISDIFGDALLAECWEFNFLHDVGFLLSALHADARRRHIPVHVVHGFWKQEDPRRLALVEEAALYGHVHLHAAFMPEPFGTHHSKMAVLFRSDGTARVAIYTANLIPHDWANMTQGVWLSPVLPLAATAATASHLQESGGALGTGPRFKADLLRYLRAYNARRPVCEPLVAKLARYDFSAVRAALVASVPGRHAVQARPASSASAAASCSPRLPQWGWAGLQAALQSVPVQDTASSEIVVQVSSMATLGPTDAWLRRTLFAALTSGQVEDRKDRKDRRTTDQPQPRLRVVFPTADEIRRSLNGYDSGSSIHTKIQSPQQQKQLQYMRPVLCHWAHDAPQGAKLPVGAVREAGRKRAAPHIKTYVRYGANGIDWALLTSANLSKQAWGEAVTPAGEMRIASWEVGVLVWPGLFADGAVMQAAFGRDNVRPEAEVSATGTDTDTAVLDFRPVVALRIPYNLPLQSYGKDETPWVATMAHREPDWSGRTWEGV